MKCKIINGKDIERQSYTKADIYYIIRRPKDKSSLVQDLEIGAHEQSASLAVILNKAYPMNNILSVKVRYYRESK